MAMGLPFCNPSPQEEEDVDLGGHVEASEEPSPYQNSPLHPDDVAEDVQPEHVEPDEEVHEEIPDHIPEDVETPVAEDVVPPIGEDLSPFVEDVPEKHHAAERVASPHASPDVPQRSVDFDFTTPDISIHNKGEKRLKDVGPTSKKRKTLGDMFDKIKNKKARRTEKRHVEPIAEPSAEPTGESAEVPHSSSSKTKILQSDDKRTRIGKKRVPSNVPKVDAKGTIFYIENGAARWNYIAQRRCAPEKVLSEYIRKNDQMMMVIEACVMPSLLIVGPWYEHMIRGFLANIPAEINNPSSPFYHKVTFRDHTFDFSPAVIKAYLERENLGETGDDLDLDVVASILTGGALEKWPSRGTPFRASTLVVPYSVLHKIAIVNWLPTTHTASLTIEMGRLLYMVCSGSEFNLGEC